MRMGVYLYWGAGDSHPFGALESPNDTGTELLNYSGVADHKRIMVSTISPNEHGSVSILGRGRLSSLRDIGVIQQWGRGAGNLFPGFGGGRLKNFA